MKTEKQIEKYVKRMTGLTIKIKFKNHFWGGFWGMACYNTNTIELKKILLKNNKWLKGILWHEIGHFFTATERDPNHLSIKNEVNAQIWAIKFTKKRKYNNLRNLLIKDVKNDKGWRDYNYRRARAIILKKVKTNKLTYMK